MSNQKNFTINYRDTNETNHRLIIESLKKKIMLKTSEILLMFGLSNVNTRC